MKKDYLICYNYTDKNGGVSVGDVILSTDSSITKEAIEKIREGIKQDCGYSQVIILNIIKLADADEII
jgi:hypothetical protein